MVLLGSDNPGTVGILFLVMLVFYLIGHYSHFFEKADWSWTNSIGGPIALGVVMVTIIVIWRDIPFALLLASVACVYATVALGNNLITGLLGYVDLSAAGILAIGAYTAAIVGRRLDWPVPVSLV